MTAGNHTYLVAGDGHVIATTAKPSPHLVSVVLPADSKLAVGTTSDDRQLGSALWLLHSTPAWFRQQFGAITAIEPRQGTLDCDHGSEHAAAAGCAEPARPEDARWSSARSES